MISIRRSLAAFFAWWGSELAACIPSQLIESLLPQRRLTLLWQGNEVAVRWVARPVSKELGRISTDVAESIARTEFLRMTADVPTRNAEVTVELPSELILRREVDLPSAAAENLREVLGFELDRLTPFKAEDAVFDYKITSIDRATKRMTVSLAVAPRTVITQIQAFGNTIGVAPDRVVLSSATTGRNQPSELPLADRAPPQDVRRRRLTMALGVLAAILVTLAVWLPLQRKQAMLAAYEERLAELRPQATAAADLREQVKASAEQGSFILRRRSETPLAVSVLKEITERLADDTWLVQLRLSGQSLSIAGYAPTATSLVPILEASPQLTDVNFSAPVTPDATVNKDRFGIIAEVVGQ
jgi:general secretion pathway protein L